MTDRGPPIGPPFATARGRRGRIRRRAGRQQPCPIPAGRSIRHCSRQGRRRDGPTLEPVRISKRFKLDPARLTGISNHTSTESVPTRADPSDRGPVILCPMKAGMKAAEILAAATPLARRARPISCLCCSCAVSANCNRAGRGPNRSLQTRRCPGALVRSARPIANTSSPQAFVSRWINAAASPSPGHKAENRPRSRRQTVPHVDPSPSAIASGPSGRTLAHAFRVAARQSSVQYEPSDRRRRSAARLVIPSTKAASRRSRLCPP